MADIVKFSSIRLTNSGKKGMLQKDEDGYVTTVLGGLDVCNVSGELYTAAGAKELFTESSPFMRRIQRGALRGELGHPQYQKGMSTQDFLARFQHIEESNVAAHFKEIWLDFDSIKGPNGQPVVAILGKVCPSGPKGPQLEKSLNNPHENVCFSVRGITKDYYKNGRNNRELKNIITFDQVNEPGIPIAEKYMSPSMESLAEKFVSKDELAFNIESLSRQGVAAESSIALAKDIFSSLGWDIPKGVVPIYKGW